MFASLLRKAALPVAAGALMAASLAQAQDATKITIGHYIPSAIASVVSMPLEVLAERTDIQAKHGISIELVDYSNLNSLYSDQALGRVEVNLTGPSSLAAAAAKGAPLSLAGSIGRATAAVLSNGKEWNAESLKGARLVAQTSSSSWIALQAIIERDLGLKGGSDYEVINSDSTAAAALQVAAGQADYAIVRAEQVLLALKKFDNLKMVADPKALGREKGEADFGYVMSFNNQKHDYATMVRMMAALAEVGDWMKANPDEIEARAVASGQEPGIAKDFLTTGLLQFDIRPATEVKDAIKADYDLLTSVGYLTTEVPASVFPE